jgi:hypothetical protein
MMRSGGFKPPVLDMAAWRQPLPTVQKYAAAFPRHFLIDIQ